MVSDADGKQYPWYGAKNEVLQLHGPTQQSTPVTVSMHDTCHPQVWLSYRYNILMSTPEHDDLFIFYLWPLAKLKAALLCD